MSSLGTRLRGLREAKGCRSTTSRAPRGSGAGTGGARDRIPSASSRRRSSSRDSFARIASFSDASPDEALELYREASGEPVKPAAVRCVRCLAPPSRRAGPLVISIVLFVALGASLFALRIGLSASRKDTATARCRRHQGETDPAPRARKAGASAPHSTVRGHPRRHDRCPPYPCAAAVAPRSGTVRRFGRQIGPRGQVRKPPPDRSRRRAHVDTGAGGRGSGGGGAPAGRRGPRVDRRAPVRRSRWAMRAASRWT